MSSVLTIAVLRWEDGWRLLRGGQRAGAFDFKVDAEEAGIRMATEAHASGLDVKLMVQDAQTSEVREMTGWGTRH